MNNLQKYVDTIYGLLSRIAAEENESINQAADYIAEYLGKDKNHLLHIIGTGEHSTMAASELFKRAGGFFQTNAILTNAVYYERQSGLISKELDRYVIEEGSPAIVASHVGVNTLTIEAAECFKKKGCFLIGVDAREISNSLPRDFHTRHPSGKNLYEICDVTIDAKIPFGDAVIEVDGAPQKIAPVSSYLIFAALHMLEIRIVEKMLEKGYEPGIYRSGNIPGGDEFNDKYKKFYTPLLKNY